MPASVRVAAAVLALTTLAACTSGEPAAAPSASTTTSTSHATSEPPTSEPDETSQPAVDPVADRWVTAGDAIDSLGAIYEASSLDDLVVPLVMLLDQLQPVGWTPSSQELEFGVSADVAIQWFSNRTYLQLAEEGIDLAVATADAYGYARPVAGGVEILLDLTEPLSSVPGATAGMPESVRTLVKMIVNDLGTTAEIAMPDPADISTEPPVG